MKFTDCEQNRVILRGFLAHLYLKMCSSNVAYTSDLKDEDIAEIRDAFQGAVAEMRSEEKGGDPTVIEMRGGSEVFCLRMILVKGVTGFRSGCFGNAPASTSELWKEPLFASHDVWIYWVKDSLSSLWRVTDSLPDNALPSGERHYNCYLFSLPGMWRGYGDEFRSAGLSIIFNGQPYDERALPFVVTGKKSGGYYLQKDCRGQGGIAVYALSEQSITNLRGAQCII